MKYANWENKTQMKKVLTKISLNKDIKKSGMPLIEEGENLYIADKDGHSLVIGASGSGKTQTTILPVMRLAMESGESVVVHDVGGELYKKIANKFEEKGYKTIVIDLKDSIYGNYWNPLDLPYKLYKTKNSDRAIEYIEDIGYYLITNEKHSSSADPFWEKSAIDLFTGIVLHLFENKEIEEINLKTIYNIANQLSEKDSCTSFLKELDSNSIVHTYLYSVLSTADETRKSIIAVFSQKLKSFITYTNLSNMMKKSDFDITEISNNKTAVFIISGNTKHPIHLIPLFVHQVISSVELFGTKEKRLNLLLDEFDNMIPIQNFAQTIAFARSNNVHFTVIIKSFSDLINIYGKENTEKIKMCFSNIIYLLSNDFYTLEEISKLCGNQSKDIPLVTIEELKTLNCFESIVLIPRHMPFKTTLTPDYKINWGYKDIEKELPERN